MDKQYSIFEKKIILGLVILLVALRAHAQDPHFTQFFASPLTLNPAYTGLFEGTTRVAGNYRNQWSSIAKPYTTGTLAADIHIPIGKNGNHLGVGLLSLYDRSLGHALRTICIGPSIAYSKAFDDSGKEIFSLGVQVNMVRRSLDLSNLIFEDQILNKFLIPTRDRVVVESLNYLDYNIGILYNIPIAQKGHTYAGLSYYHITEPKTSFLSKVNKDRLSSRYVLHGGIGLALTEEWLWYSNLIYMQQAKAGEVTIGGVLGFVLDNSAINRPVLYLGIWHRWKDAISPYLGLEMGKWQSGITYDINLSGLRRASGLQGGMELSFSYIFSKEASGLRCPKF